MNGPATRIELLGGLRIAVSGRPREAELRGRQGRLLLAFLVLERRRPVRRDELIEALWAHEGAPPSDTALAPVLSRLRRALEPAAIEGRDLLSIVLPEPVEVDVEVLGERIAEARSALAQGEAAAALDAARAAEQAAARGLLPGLDAPWLEAPRTACEDQRVTALELAARAGLALGAGALGAAERDARAAVAQAPFRESARAVLIEILRAQGNVAEAVLAYDDIRLLLRDELGTAPGPELDALHETLLHATPAAPVVREVARPAHAGDPLVERSAELHAIGAALTGVGRGGGRVLLLEGPAGVGKTSLLAALRDEAAAAGFSTRFARAGVLERDYAFGVARQLLGDAGDTHPPDDGDGSFARLAALHARVRELSSSGPLLLAVDDLQWSDTGSLRFAAYLARRLSDLPVLLAATIRTGEADVDDALLAELAQEPGAIVLAPRPLSSSGTGELVRGRLGADADAAFTAACHEVTGGNPLLVGQLASALAAEGVAPDAAHASQVRAVGPRAVSRTVLLRLRRLSEEATAVARAVATLGRSAQLRAVAAVAEVDDGVAAAAVSALVRAEVLRDAEPLEFVHPLVRDAIYSEQPAAGRGLDHLRAAGILASLEADPEAVAAQLVLAPPRGDRWVVEHLREAAGLARRRGAPDSALSYLRRAQAEPPPRDVQAELALELGAVAALVNGPEGVEPLRAALDQLDDPAARGQAALQLSRLLLFVGPADEGIAVAARELERLPGAEDDLRDALAGVLLMASLFGGTTPLPELDSPLSGTPLTVHGPGSRMLAAASAFLLSLACRPVGETSPLARIATESDELFAADVGLFGPPAGIVLFFEDPELGLPVFDRMAEHARRSGKLLTVVAADLWAGFALAHAGRPEEALARYDGAEEGLRLYGNPGGVVFSMQARAWLELGEVARAREVLERTAAAEGASVEATYRTIAQIELALAEGRLREAVALSERLEEAFPPAFHPLYAPWRGLRALALAGLGERDAAAALARDELALAQQTQSRWVEGRGERLLGEVLGTDGADHLRRAIELLEPTTAAGELRRARALLAPLGEA